MAGDLPAAVDCAVPPRVPAQNPVGAQSPACSTESDVRLHNTKHMVAEATNGGGGCAAGLPMGVNGVQKVKRVNRVHFRFAPTTWQGNQESWRSLGPTRQRALIDARKAGVASAAGSGPVTATIGNDSNLQRARTHTRHSTHTLSLDFS